METKNNTKSSKIVLIAIVIIILIRFIFIFGWIAGIIYLLFFRKRLNNDQKKQQKITIAVSVLSVASFIFMIYSFVTYSPLKYITISLDTDEQELDVYEYYTINIKCEPENANLKRFIYHIDGSCATLTNSTTDEMKANLYTTSEGTAIIFVSNGKINSNSLEFTIVDKNKQETSKNVDKDVKESSQNNDKDKDKQEESDNEFPKTINDDIDIVFSKTVEKDVTGKWRLASVSTEKEIQTYALEYYQSFFQSDDEIHAIVNSSLNTTNKIAKISDDILDVSVHEYIDGEEHDAKILFSGTLLGNYQINISTDEVTQIPIGTEELSENDAADTSDGAENLPETPAPTTSEEPTTPEEPATPTEPMVWIDDTGRKYHSKPSCSNMSDPYQVPKSEAEAMGRDACKKCY